MEKRLVLIGGGHAHLTALLHLDHFTARGHRVTLIGPSPHHYYSGMGPGLLSGIYRPQECRFNIQKMSQDRGAAFVQGKVLRIDAEHRRLHLDSGNEIPYDVVSCNTGSHVPVERVEDREDWVFPVKPIENLLRAREIIIERLKTRSLNLLVVGGGPAGLELAGNLWKLVRDQGGSAQITLLAGRKLLAAGPERVHQSAKRSLEERNIAVVEGAAVDRLADGAAVMMDGRRYPADIVLLAWGIEPSSIYRESGLPTDLSGGLLVNDYLQCVKYPEMFGGGDCITFQRRPLNKVGVYPVRENPILYHNLLAALSGESMKAFDPQEVYLLIFNLGDGRAIFWKGNRVFHGKWCFWLKDYIDRRFMRSFQVSEELSED